MSYESYSDIDENEGPETYSSAGDTLLKGGLKNHLVEDKHALHGKPFVDKNPYSNKEVTKFIKYLGFDVDEVPRFTEMAKKLNTTIKHEDTEKDLTNFDNHDMIQDVSPHKAENLEIRKQALKRLIAKYKG